MHNKKASFIFPPTIFTKRLHKLMTYVETKKKNKKGEIGCQLSILQRLLH
jgi:hypothetical protein